MWPGWIILYYEVGALERLRISFHKLLALEKRHETPLHQRPHSHVPRLQGGLIHLRILPTVCMHTPMQGRQLHSLVPLLCARERLVGFCPGCLSWKSVRQDSSTLLPRLLSLTSPFYLQCNQIHHGLRSGIVVLGNGKGVIRNNQIFSNKEAGIYILYHGNPIVR